VRRAERRLDRADAAARGLRAADDRELALCGGNDEEHEREGSGAAPTARRRSDRKGDYPPSCPRISPAGFFAV